MSSKSKNKKVGICLIVGTTCIALVGPWAVLSTPRTALAAKKENPGGNVKQQDISAEVTFDDGSLTSDGGPYADGQSNVECKTGRRRTIWVKFGKNSSRRMTLNLGVALTHLAGDSDLPKVSLEDIDPELSLPSGDIDRLLLYIAVGHNVSGLGEEFVEADLHNGPLLYCAGVPDPETDDPANFNCILTNMRIDFRDVTQGYNWRLYFGPGPQEGGAWPGGTFFSNPEPSLNAYVTVTRALSTGPAAGRLWEVRTSQVDRDADGSADAVPGFLYFRGTKPNDPHIYVGAFDIPWSCDAVSLE
jgi:hypothetical protein